MMEPDVHRTLGELSAAVKGIRDAITENRELRRDEMVRLEASIREAKHEQRNAMQSNRAGIDLIDRRVRAVEVALPQLALEITKLGDEVQHVRKPVDELVSYRQRVGAMAFVLMGALTLTATLVGPLITSAIERAFSLLTRG